MKKVISLLLPLVASSFLFGCGSNSQPKYFTVTFDAGEGTFSDGRTFTLDIKKGTKIKKLIDVIKEPIKDSYMTFACYKYSNGSMLKYGDRVTKNMTLKAKYLSNYLVQKDVLDDMEWEDISAICTGGNPDKWFEVGATKTGIDVNGINHPVRVIGINHDKITNLDQTAGLTFEFANVISIKDRDNNKAVETAWNESNDNRDFLNSTLNKKVNNFYSSLPDYLKAIIQKVDKKVACGSDYNIKTYSTNLFPLSCVEIGSTSGIFPEDEGNVYTFYTYGDTTKKTKTIVDDESANYWLRSPAKSSDDFAAYITGKGELNEYSIPLSLAFAPAFCI